jgi:hypothetical protein
MQRGLDVEVEKLQQTGSYLGVSDPGPRLGASAPWVVGYRVVALGHVLTELVSKIKRDDVHQSVLSWLKAIVMMSVIDTVIDESHSLLPGLGHLPCLPNEENL